MAVLGPFLLFDSDAWDIYFEPAERHKNSQEARAFIAAIQALIQSSLDVPSCLPVLGKICARLEGAPIRWAITGSLGMALQGVPVAVHDIDMQTDEAGAYEIERRLAEWVVEPVQYVASERIRSHLGGLEIDGVPVEIIGALQKRLAGGTWEPPVRVEPFRQWVVIDGMRIPVLSLEYEAQAYRQLGRPEKAALLQNWLQEKRKSRKTDAGSDGYT